MDSHTQRKLPIDIEVLSTRLRAPHYRLIALLDSPYNKKYIVMEIIVFGLSLPTD